MLIPKSSIRLARSLLLLGPMVLAMADASFAEQRIRYDRQCLTIDGKDRLIFSGTFHYFRCPKELWRARFERIKEAGCNAVETVVVWNVHEPQEPSNIGDFSKVDLKDLDEWLTMAEEFGLYVIARPGPYICAEWDRAGFPGWLIKHRPAHPKLGEWFRTDDPDFIAWSRHWYDAVCPLLARHQITHKPAGSAGIILFQIENEYDYAHFPTENKRAYLSELASEARKQGIDVPIFTCWTREIRGNHEPALQGVFDSCNFYPGFNIERLNVQMKALREQQPNAPMMTAEMQGGWFTQLPHEQMLQPDVDRYREDLPPAQLNNITLLALQNGETIINYYMLFGGTNFGDTGAHYLATSYDYSAPIRECGGVGEKYLRVKAIGQMLKEHGEKLARSEAVPCQTNTGAKDVTAVERRATDGSRYIFIRTAQHTENRHGTIQIQEKGRDGAKLTFDYDLEPLGAKILYLPAGANEAKQPEWLPKAIAPIERPGELPRTVKITQVAAMDNPEPANWIELNPGSSLNDVGIYYSRYVQYRAIVHLPRADLSGDAKLNLQVNAHKDDHILVELNGRRLPPIDSATNGHVYAVTGQALHDNDNEIRMLYENTGCANMGPEMEKKAGIIGVNFFRGDPTERQIQGWSLRVVKVATDQHQDPEQLATAGDGSQQNGFHAVGNDEMNGKQLSPGQFGLFKTSLNLTSSDLSGGKAMLHFARLDDEGWIFINGKKLGEAHDWRKAFSFDAAKLFHPGENSIAVVVRNLSGAGGLEKVELQLAEPPAIGKLVTLSYADQAFAEAAKWSMADFADAEWTAHPLPEASAEPSHAMLTWRRFAFELPANDEQAWVPWLIRCNASGNGFVYLNGHALGRYWQAGKQRDFYMPECWLNFGTGKKNVVTLCLRPVETSAAVESAEVIPYTVYAEKR